MMGEAGTDCPARELTMFLRHRRLMRADLLSLLGQVWVRAWLVLILLLCSQGPAAAQRIVEFGRLLDPDSLLTIEEVRHAAFDPAPPMSSAGYTDQTIWFRLTVRPDPVGGELSLRVWPSYLDNLVLYEAAEDGWRARTTGDRIPFAQRDHTVSLAFDIAPEAETTYFLRLRTTSSSLLSVEVVPRPDVAADDLRFGILLFVYLGIGSWMLTWGIIEFWDTREPLLLWFCLSQSLTLAHAVSVTGYLAVLVADLPTDWLTSLVLCVAPLAMMAFHFSLLREFDIHPAARGLGWLLLAAAAVVVALMLAGLVQLALQLNAYVVVSIPIVIAIAAFTARREAPPGRLPLRVVYAVQCLLLPATIAPLLGLAPPTDFIRAGILIHGASSSLVAFIVLQARARGLRLAAAELGITRRQLEAEKRQHASTDRLLAILTHELRTPLSVAKLSLATIPETQPSRRRLVGALDTIAALIDRSAVAERLDADVLQVDRRPELLSHLVNRAVESLEGSERIVSDRIPELLLQTDGQLFGIVLRNLLDNALRYSPAGSPITLTAGTEERAQRSGVRICVGNRPGRAGWPDPDQLFSRHYRAPGASHLAGSGLGLYIARGIVQLLGGELVYRAEPEIIRFEVWLPC